MHVSDLVATPRPCPGLPSYNLKQWHTTSSNGADQGYFWVSLHDSVEAEARGCPMGPSLTIKVSGAVTSSERSETSFHFRFIVMAKLLG